LSVTETFADFYAELFTAVKGFMIEASTGFVSNQKTIFFHFDMKSEKCQLSLGLVGFWILPKLLKKLKQFCGILKRN